jgi:hypothetical protein
MGSHASQISPKGLWQIIQYIKVMQNGGEMPSFNEDGAEGMTENQNNN